jgi:hypothetical protein
VTAVGVLLAASYLAASYQSAGRTAHAIALKEHVAANLAVSYWSADRTSGIITMLGG